MENFVTKNIIQLVIPFETVYTSCFLVSTPEGTALLDCATTKQDVDHRILPTLTKHGLVPDLIFVSHSHGDHMGGLPFLAEAFPKATLVMRRRDRAEQYPSSRCLIPEDGTLLLECLRVLALPGHSPDSAALLDERSNTLFSFDCLQAQGLDRFGTGLNNIADYISSINRIKSKDIDKIVASHRYEPLGTEIIEKQDIPRFLDICLADIDEILAFTRQFPTATEEEIAKRFNADHPSHPLIGKGTIGAARRHIQAIE